MPRLLPSRRQLHVLSREPAVLVRAMLLVLGVFVLNAAVLSWLRASPPDRLPENAGVLSSGPSGRAEELRRLLAGTPPDLAGAVRCLREDAFQEYRAAQGVDGPGGEGMAPDPGYGPEGFPLPDFGGGVPEESGAAGAGTRAGKAGARRQTPGVRQVLESSTLPAGEKQILGGWHEALARGMVTAELAARVEAFVWPGKEGLSRMMAGDLRRGAGEFQAALADYKAAAELPGGEEARLRAVDLALRQDWTDTLDHLLDQPAYRTAVYAAGDRLAHEAASYRRDVAMLFRQTAALSAEMMRKRPDLLGLSLLSAAIWFVSLHMACRLPLRQWWPGLAAVGLGMFSTVITVVLLSLQEARGGLTDSPEAVGALIYQLAGVGLREETSKLLSVLPVLLFLLWRRGTPAQALMAASGAGLGFALEENIGYYLHSGGSAVIARFMTANFMHLAMTGLSGLALFRFLRWPRNFGGAFIGTFTGMVLLHGFYNFSQTSYGDVLTRELPPLVPFMLAGLAWYYFQEIRREQEDSRQALGASAVFLLGTAVLTGVILNFLVWESGWQEAVRIIVPTVLACTLLCWLFVRFLRDA